MGAGLRLVPWTATLLVVAPVNGLLADRVGDRPLLLVGLILQVVGLGGWLSQRRPVCPTWRYSARSSSRMLAVACDSRATL